MSTTKAVRDVVHLELTSIFGFRLSGCRGNIGALTSLSSHTGLSIINSSVLFESTCLDETNSSIGNVVSSTSSVGERLLELFLVFQNPSNKLERHTQARVSCDCQAPTRHQRPRYLSTRRAVNQFDSHSPNSASSNLLKGGGRKPHLHSFTSDLRRTHE